MTRLNSELACNLTVALKIFRITLALIFGTPVPKVSKPHLGSISSSNWYDQRVDRVKKWLSTCQFVFISGPLPVKRPPKKKFRKIFIAPKVSSWNFRGSLLSYFWAITFISAVIAILDPFGTLVPRISATVKVINGSHRQYHFSLKWWNRRNCGVVLTVIMLWFKLAQSVLLV